MGGCVVDGWVEFLCWVCLGFGIGFCVGGSVGLWLNVQLVCKTPMNV